MSDLVDKVRAKMQPIIPSFQMTVTDPEGEQLTPPDGEGKGLSRLGEWGLSRLGEWGGGSVGWVSGEGAQSAG